MSENFNHWKSLSRQLHHLCINTFGEDLLHKLMALSANAEREAVTEAVRLWLETLVLPELHQRGTERAVDLQGLLAHEGDKQAFSRRLASALPKIRRAWDWRKQQWRDKQAVLAMLGQAFQQFLNDAHTGGSQREQNWQRMDKAIRILQQEALARAAKEGWSDARLSDALNRFDKDLAWLAAELLAYFQRATLPHGRLKDVSTVEGVLSYFYDFMPGLVISLPEDESALFDLHVPLLSDAEMIESLYQCLRCLDCITRLSDEERQVIKLILSKDETGESDAELAQRMGMKRGTFLNRQQAAMEKLRQCLEAGSG